VEQVARTLIRGVLCKQLIPDKRFDPPVDKVTD
jgi:hypothetical protein